MKFSEYEKNIEFINRHYIFVFEKITFVCYNNRTVKK